MGEEGRIYVGVKNQRAGGAISGNLANSHEHLAKRYVTPAKLYRPSDALKVPRM